METLSSSSSKVFSDNYRDRGFSSPRDFLGRREIRFLSSPIHVRVGFSNSISLQHKRIHPIFVSSLSSSSSETQENLQDEETQIQDTSKTVHVKFQLQKRCAFGEQFHIIGDDPMFGSWEPLSAIPLDWSEGHVWTVELDIPIGKSIQFKFILKGKTGNIWWQPGPDRILVTWETTNTISVSEDWDNAELQMLVEEEPASNGKVESTSNSEMLIVAENLSQPRGGLAADVDRASASTDTITNNSTAKPLLEKSMSMVADNIASPVEEPRVQTRIVDYAKEERVHVSNKETITNNSTAKPLLEKSMSMVADNIVSPVEEPRVQTRIVDYAKEERVHVSNKDIDTGENALGNNGRVGTIKSSVGTKDDVNLVAYEGDPVLVPGLTQLTTADSEEKSSSEDDKIVASAPLGVDKQVNEHNVSEMQVVDILQIFSTYSNQTSQLDLKKNPDNNSSHPKDLAEMRFNGEEEEVHGNEQAEPISKQFGNVVKNDLQWGCKTLQKLLTGFGFFRHQNN